MPSSSFRSAALIAAGAICLVASSATSAAQSASASRNIAWDGDESLTIVLGSDVVYTQGSRAGVTVTGERAVVENVVVRNGKIHLDPDWARQFWERGESVPKVRVAVTAPAVERFVFSSGGSFTIENYDRDELSFVHNGGGSARVSGAADSLRYVLNGGATVDLSRLSTDSAQVVVNGRGDLQVRAKQALSATVNGQGSVTLLNTPPQLRKRVNGAGRILGG